MAKKTNKSATGTSFHNTYLYTTVGRLLKLFPDSCSNGDGGYKSYYEFTLETENGDVFTIYDWKEGYDNGLNREIEFHIGGRNQMVTEQARRELQAFL